jgi:replicative DNA helicase
LKPNKFTIIALSILTLLLLGAILILVGVNLNIPNLGWLNPQGFVATEQKSLLIKTTLIMFAITLPAMFLTYFFAFKYRAQNNQLTADDMNRLSVAAAKAERMKFYTDNHSRTVSQVATAARKIKRKHGLDLIVVDYIGLMQGQGETQALRIASITGGLKRLAMDMVVPLIALSQLNRQVASRTDHRPMMSDLRDSGAIEQDADAIVMVYQDEKYNPDSPYKGIAEAIIAKARMGETGRVYLQFDGERSRFRNADMRELASIRHEQEQAASAKSNRRYASL